MARGVAQVPPMMRAAPLYMLLALCRASILGRLCAGVGGRALVCE
jgi:hypothetical protein